MTRRVLQLDTTRLEDLDLDQIVYCHIAAPSLVWTSDFIVTSVLDSIDTEMRQARGFDLTSTYVPLLAAFAILDQLGSCYEDASMVPHPPGGSSIERALYYFGGFGARSPEVEHLYALRNGLVHDASLTSHNRGKTKWYIFRLSPSKPDAITLAPKAWNGAAGMLDNQVVTWVNVREFTDLVSIAIDRVKQMYFDRPNDLVKLKSADEILHKYLFWRARPSEN